MNKAEKLLEAIRNASQKLRDIKSQHLEQSELQDLSLVSFRYIELIHALGEPTLHELAQNMGLSKPTVTVMIAKLVDMGLVIKKRAHNDKRSYCLNLTAKSIAILEQYHQVQRLFADQIMAKFGDDEIEKLTSLLNRI